jgi:hypothetical protein
MKSQIKKIKAAKNLSGLLEAILAIRQEDQSIEFDKIMERLPTFGGEEPAETDGIWSWDRDNLLVSNGAGDLAIIDRPSYEVVDLETDEVLEGTPSQTLINKSMAGRHDSGAVRAIYDEKTEIWDISEWIPGARIVYVREW